MPRPPARDTPLYAEIAQRLADQIERGTYRVGDAIPSIRAGSKLFGVSAGTLLEAYQQLEDRGYVRARPQSGYYVRQRPSAALCPPPNAPTSGKPREVHINLAVEMLRRMADRDLLQLGAAVPDASFLPARALNMRTARALRIHDQFVHAYGPPAGLPAMRQRLARLMADTGCELSADDLVVTNGCSEAVSLCLRAVTKPGDTVAIESPAYYGLLFSLKALGLHALPIETSVVTGLSVDALERAAIRHRIAAVAITPSFANPTGSCMPEPSRRRLVDWARRTGTPVIEDDIYGELHFEEQRPRPLFAFDSAGLVLYCASVSKTLSPGLRVGWCAPGKYLSELE